MQATSTLEAPLHESQSSAGYERRVLQNDGRSEVVLARWVDGGTSELHGHGESSVVVRVMSGRVREERFIPEGLGYRYECVELVAGVESYLPAGSFHRVESLGESVTMQINTPPLIEAREVVPEDIAPLLDAAKRAAQHD